MDFIALTAINIIKVIKYAILIRILISWVRPYGANGKIYQVIYQVSEPTMRFFRKLIPSGGMIDFSPILAFFALDLLEIGITSMAASF